MAPLTGGVAWRSVSPRYFEVFKIALRRGRFFTERDGVKAAGVVLINEAMAKRFWPKEPGGAAYHDRQERRPAV